MFISWFSAVVSTNPQKIGLLGTGPFTDVAVSRW